MEIALIKSYSNKPWRSPETYELIEDSLREKWRVRSIHTKNPQALYGFINRLKHEGGKQVFVFNIAEYLDEEKKAGFLPSLLEEWKVNHLGSRAKAIDIGLNKARTKEILDRYQIPTPQYFIATREDPENRIRAEKISYPLIVKPIEEGGHIGVREDSIVNDYAHLKDIINRVLAEHHQPALVEEYITGKGMREFSVGIIEGKIRLFTPVEIDFESMDGNHEILSFESAKKDLERIKPLRDKEILDQIIDLSIKTFNAIGANDYSRVDLRMNHTGCYVIEINIMPGLGPHSFLPEAAKGIHAIEYNQLIQKLTENSLQRQINGK
ncbi:MAG TPA: ATP-grasp domain-containing protein [Chloroflexi bacterium]|nr:ATP-grasp domain-containing protein [Chloroflexota bacterium]